jgi:hypothetical protein
MKYLKEIWRENDLILVTEGGALTKSGAKYYDVIGCIISIGNAVYNLTTGDSDPLIQLKIRRFSYQRS